MDDDRVSTEASDEPAAGGEDLVTQAQERWEVRRRFEQAGVTLSQAQESEIKSKIDYLEKRLKQVSEQQFGDAERKYNKHVDQLRQSVDSLADELEQALASERKHLKQNRDEISLQLKEGVEQAIQYIREARQAGVDKVRDKSRQIADEFESHIDRILEDLRGRSKDKREQVEESTHTAREQVEESTRTAREQVEKSTLTARKRVEEISSAALKQAEDFRHGCLKEFSTKLEATLEKTREDLEARHRGLEETVEEMVSTLTTDVESIEKETGQRQDRLKERIRKVREETVTILDEEEEKVHQATNEVEDRMRELQNRLKEKQEKLQKSRDQAIEEFQATSDNTIARIGEEKQKVVKDFAQLTTDTIKEIEESSQEQQQKLSEGQSKLTKLAGDLTHILEDVNRIKADIDETRVSLEKKLRRHWFLETLRSAVGAALIVGVVLLVCWLGIYLITSPADEVSPTMVGPQAELPPPPTNRESAQEELQDGRSAGRMLELAAVDRREGERAARMYLGLLLRLKSSFDESMTCSLLAAALNDRGADLAINGDCEQITATILADHLPGKCGELAADEQHTCYLATYLRLHNVDFSNALGFAADRAWDLTEEGVLLNLLRSVATEMEESSEVRKRLEQLDLKKSGSAEMLSDMVLRPEDAEKLLRFAEELWGVAGAMFPDAEATELSAVKQHLESQKTDLTD